MKKRYVFVFPTEVIDEPLTYRLIKDYDLKINIFNVYINSGEEGNLALEIEGAFENIKAGLKYAKSLGIKCTTLDRRLKFDQERCINCGACIAVCYSGALHINNNKWELTFDKEKCTVCELCTDACPLGLFKIDFVE